MTQLKNRCFKKRWFVGIIVFLASVCLHYSSFAKEKEWEINSFSGLVIDEDIVNDPYDMDVKVKGNIQPDIYRVRKGAPRGGYKDDNGNGIRTNILHNYIEESGKIYFEYNNLPWTEYLFDEEIEVTYPKVGYMETKTLERREIGAKLTINNFYRGTNETRVGIDISSNLFSGMYLYGMNAADWQFEFFYTDTKEIIDFDASPELYDTSSMTFNSLNGYSNTDPDNGKNPEFVKEINDREAVLSRDTIISKSTVSTDFGRIHYTFFDVYHGSHNTFIDDLGSSNFHIASAQFPLEGKSNTFQIGTAFRANSGWFAFSSAKIDAPYRHRNPIKTVQPINQYRENDLPNNPTGEESGFEQRYWDDLDVYEKGVSTGVGLPDVYKVEEHDMNKPEKLAPGVPKKENRFVEVGDEYYYFINQKTINIGSDGVLSPTGYFISDNLPEGVELAEKPFTLYNLDGNTIPIDNEGYQGKQSFDLKFTKQQTDAINSLSRKHEYYGFDFSLRVKVKVNDHVDINKLLNNQAESTFTYFGADRGSDDSITQKSNTVSTKLRNYSIDFKKVNQLGSGLNGAEFQLYEFDESKENKRGKLVDTQISNSEGKVVFDNNLSPGKYVIVESETPTYYPHAHEDVVVEILKSAEVVWPEGIDKEIVNDKDYNLTLYKVDELGSPLKGAKFRLSDWDAEHTKYPLTPMTKTSDENGRLFFGGGPMKKGQSYKLEEVEAPVGYELIKDIYKVDLSEDGLEAYLTKPDGKKVPLDVRLVDRPAGSDNEVTGSKDTNIPNQRMKTTLEIIKKDKDSNQTIEGVGFKLFKEGESPDVGETYLTDKDGKITIDKLDTSVVYHIKEVKTPNDYVMLKQDIILKYDTSQKRWVVFEEGSNKELDEVEWNPAKNHLSVTIFNEQKKILPSTGGRGNILTVLVSSFFFLSSVAYFYRSIRREV